MQLNKQQQAIVNALPEGMRAEATKTLLQTKVEKKARADKNRNEFRISKYESGTVGVFGLGRQFPVSLYPSEWDKLIANVEAIKAALVGMPRE